MDRIKKGITSRGGFTLLEVVIVMVLILVVVGASTVYFANLLPSQELNATGREMSAMLRFARLLARNSGEPRTVIISLDTGSYGIPGVQTRKIPRGVSVRIVDQREGEITRGDYPVVFDESGGIPWGRITLTTGRKSINIELDPVIGAVVLR